MAHLNWTLNLSVLDGVNLLLKCACDCMCVRVHAGPCRACPHEEEAALQLLQQDVLGR